MNPLFFVGHSPSHNPTNFEIGCRNNFFCNILVKFEFFWLNIAKFGIYLRYRHCSKLFRELRKKSEFRQRCCRNSTKVWERNRKSEREKILNFGNHITEILAVQTCWLKTNCGNVIVEIGGKNFCGNAIAKNGRKKE